MMTITMMMMMTIWTNRIVACCAYCKNIVLCHQWQRRTSRKWIEEITVTDIELRTDGIRWHTHKPLKFSVLRKHYPTERTTTVPKMHNNCKINW